MTLPPAWVPPGSGDPRCWPDWLRPTAPVRPIRAVASEARRPAGRRTSVEATDSKGNTYHLDVDKKGFEGEKYTISGDYLAYQDLAIPLKLQDFKGIQRDGIPFGNRIFRKPYFDEQGNMTIMQWNTFSQGVDYRIGPRETKVETFTFKVPYEAAPGEMNVKAVLNYQLLVKPVADFLKVPSDESEIIKVNEHSTRVEILP